MTEDDARIVESGETDGVLWWRLGGSRYDRTGWDPGPWDSEPDKLQWEHSGVACIARRNPMGVWCGYAGVPEGHPWFKQPYQELGRYDPDVHGGLTYADLCDGHEELGICHVVEGPEPTLWWLGFDCGHAFDYCPGMESRMKRLMGSAYSEIETRSSYKDQAYVMGETNQLADQIARAS